VTNVLSRVGSQGGVHCEGFVQVARVARLPVRMAARMASIVPLIMGAKVFSFFTFVEIVPLIAPVDLGAVF
jgi:hypothetical protein